MSLRVVSEGPVKITRAIIESAWRRRAVGVRLMVRDAECRGLALVVNPHGMAWRFDYRPRGTDAYTGKRFPMQGMTVGNPASHAPDEARAAANAIKGHVVAGADPAAEKRAAAAVERRRRALTLDRLLEDYAKVVPTRPKLRGTGLLTIRYAAEELKRARAAIEAMGAGGRPVAELVASDVRRMLDCAASTPATARGRYGALSRFFDWCIDAGHADSNPCLAVARSRRPKAVAARSHFLSLAELSRLWQAADTLTFPVWRDFVRFMIAVPARQGEVAGLDWSHVNLATAEWRQPASETKNGDAHRLHLHPLALNLLRKRSADAGKPMSGLVFPAPEGRGPVTTFSDLKQRLDAASGLTGWRWHDFRRSFATALAEAGISETVADAVLNHRQAATRGGVLGVYQQATRRPEQVAAMEAWGEQLAVALALNRPRRKQTGEVVLLRPLRTTAG